MFRGFLEAEERSNPTPKDAAVEDPVLEATPSQVSVIGSTADQLLQCWQACVDEEYGQYDAFAAAEYFSVFGALSAAGTAAAYATEEIAGSIGTKAGRANQWKIRAFNDLDELGWKRDRYDHGARQLRYVKAMRFTGAAAGFVTYGASGFVTGAYGYCAVACATFGGYD